MALDERQLILLDNLIYLDDTVNLADSSVKTVTVGYIVDQLLNNTTIEEFEDLVTDDQFYYCNNMVNGMSVEEWRNVLTAIKNDEYLMNMQITNNSKAEWFFHSALNLFKYLCYVL